MLLCTQFSDGKTPGQCKKLCRSWHTQLKWYNPKPHVYTKAPPPHFEHLWEGWSSGEGWHLSQWSPFFNYWLFTISFWYSMWNSNLFFSFSTHGEETISLKKISRNRSKLKFWETNEISRRTRNTPMSESSTKPQNKTWERPFLCGSLIVVSVYAIEEQRVDICMEWTQKRRQKKQVFSAILILHLPMKQHLKKRALIQNITFTSHYETKMDAVPIGAAMTGHVLRKTSADWIIMVHYTHPNTLLRKMVCLIIH